MTKKDTPNPEIIEKKPKFNFKSLNFGFIAKLSENQKTFLAAFLSIITVFLLIFGYNFAFNTSFRDNTLGINKPSPTESSENAQIRAAIEELDRTVLKINPEDFVFQTINLEDIPVYPKSWVEKYFDGSERANALISGPSADSDSDGLSNKQEYFYGSSPKNKDTLCDGKNDGSKCTGKTDKENVDSNISPLTGLKLDVQKRFRIKRQDLLVLSQIQNSFETAAKEGVDFPTLFQLSKTIDLTRESEAISTTTVDDGRDSFLAYNKIRISVLQDFASQDELSSFTQIYELTKIDDLDRVQKKYENLKLKLNSTSVPKRFEASHKVYVLLFEKLARLVEHRKLGVDQENPSEEFRKISKDKAIEVVWTYRRLNEELDKLPKNE